MAQATYWVCPAGSGKKIKFCCPDLVADWEKLFRLMEGGQLHAAVELLEHLLQQHPDRPCLLAMKIEILYHLRRSSEAEQLVEAFLQKHPSNPAALLEKAYVLAIQAEAEQAHLWLLRGLNECSEEYPLCTPRVVYVVAHRLFAAGHYAASRALFRFGRGLSALWEEEFRDALENLESSKEIPLFLREALEWKSHLLNGSSMKEALEQIRPQVERGHWLKALEQLEQFTQQAPDQAALWWHLAVLRSWTLQTQGAIEALRRYACLAGSDEEAVLAEAIALALSADPLGDRIPAYRLTYSPEDERDLQAAFSLSKQTPVFPGQLMLPLRPEDREVPPRAYYLLLDRAAPEGEGAFSEGTLPNVIAYLALFGRQTDRPPRLEVYGVHQANRSQVEGILNQFVGQGLRPDPMAEEIGQISATRAAMGWGFFSSGPEPSLEETTKAQWYQKQFLERWLDQPLGIFQGRSPRQVLEDPQWRNTLEAVLLWVEQLAAEFRYPIYRHQLRERLGLPPLEPIDPEQTSLRSVPLYRWTEIDMEKTTDQQLVEGFVYAARFRWSPVVVRFAEALVHRPGLAKTPIWLAACYWVASGYGLSDEAQHWIEQGRRRAVELRSSCAPWDLLELGYRLERKEQQQVAPLLQHLLQQHQYEPGVLERLVSILEPFGFFDSPPSDQPSGNPDASELWTPNAQHTPASNKKLWTPGSS